jgi:hypothetical protein
MFVVARQDPTPAYVVDLYHRLPAAPKRLVEIDGSVYWMLSHPQQAATLIGDWFAATLVHPITAHATERPMLRRVTSRWAEERLRRPDVARPW